MNESSLRSLPEKPLRCRPTVVTQRPSLGGDLVPTGDFSHPVQLDQRTDQGSDADVESIASAGLETYPVTRGDVVEEWVVGAVHALGAGGGDRSGTTSSTRFTNGADGRRVTPLRPYEGRTLAGLAGLGRPLA